MSPLRAALPLLWAALPALAAAEGNRLVLACEAVVPSAEAQTTMPEPEAGAGAALPLPPPPARPVFAFAPVSLDRAGAGAVEVTAPGGETAPGVTAAREGPYAWTLGTILHTLTVTGIAEDGRVLALWHRLDQAQDAVPPEGHLTQLQCEVS